MKSKLVIAGVATAIVAAGILIGVSINRSTPPTDPTCEPVAVGAAATPNVVLGDPDYVAIVVANTANSPVASLSSDAQAVIARALTSGTDGKQHVVMISATAMPHVATIDLKPLANNGTESGNAKIVSNNLKLINMALAQPPTSQGMSLFEGIGIAQDWLISQGAKSPLIVTAASGLDDTGPFTTTAGLLNNDPEHIADSMALGNPGMSLSGTTILAQSLGYTAPPQQTATAAQRQLISDAWTLTLSRFGAKVVVDPMPAVNCSVTTDLPVETTNLPETTKVINCDQQTIDMSMPAVLLFDGDDWHLVKGADEALTPLLTVMQQNPDANLTLTGHTALVYNDDPVKDLDLSRKRALSVATWLTDRGIPASRIAASGVGSSEATCPLNRNGTQAVCAGQDRTVDAHVTGLASCPN